MYAAEAGIEAADLGARLAEDWPSLVNRVVPPEELEEETMRWCRDLLDRSPTALRMLKASFNADTDWVHGLQAVAHGATSLFYRTEEALEGRAAVLEKRRPDFAPLPALDALVTVGQRLR